MTEGLTEGGKQLLKAILKHDSYAVLCADVIEGFLRDQKHAKTMWHHKNDVHALDAEDGVTYDDYKLIKSILMITNQWEF